MKIASFLVVTAVSSFRQANSFAIPRGTIIQHEVNADSGDRVVPPSHDGFQQLPSVSPLGVSTDGYESDRKPALISTRRDLVNSIGFLMVANAIVSPVPPANASGGATAGGVYLLSAKQRYNKRVLAGVQKFLSLDARDLGQVEAFFASSDEGGWEDLSSAGYLLANAFRTSSTKAPDNLPSVKKWKAFAKDVDLLQRSLSKKDGEKVFIAYKNAEEKLDAYLEAVELPSGVELKQM